MIHFGTDGMRGRANSELTASIAYRIGRFMGKGDGEKPKRVLLGMDTRLSSPMLYCSIEAGLLSSGADVVSLAVVPTAMVSFLMEKDRGYDYGVMVSASHNPFFDNGIKVLMRGGEKLSTALEKEIEKSLIGADALPFPDGEGLGRVRDGEDERRSFVSYVSSLVDVHGKGVRVLLDCSNGSDSFYARKIFENWGCIVESINDKPDGVNINAGCGSTHIEALKKAFSAGDYDLGFAFDGDADRVIGMSKDGEIDGDAQLFMKAVSLKEKGILPSNKAVVTPMSNLGLIEALAKEGIDVAEVGVGDRNIQAELFAHGYAIGAEPSGHVIHFDLLPTGDGMISASQVVSCFAERRDIFEKALSYFRYPHVLENVRFESREEAKKASRNEAFIAERALIESEIEGEGRVFLRSSGTEPLFRIYVECRTEEKARSYADRLEKALRRI